MKTYQSWMMIEKVKPLDVIEMLWGDLKLAVKARKP